MDEITSRNHVRRRLAQIFTVAAMVIVAINCVAYFDAELTDRAVKLWPVAGSLFASIMLYLGHYTHVGSVENKAAITAGR